MNNKVDLGVEILKHIGATSTGEVSGISKSNSSSIDKLFDDVSKVASKQIEKALGNEIKSKKGKEVRKQIQKYEIL